MSLDEAAEVALPCPGPTTGVAVASAGSPVPTASLGAAGAASGSTALSVSAGATVPTLVALNLSTLGCNASVTTLSAPLNFTWQDLTVVAVSCVVIALIVIGNTLVIVAVLTTRRLRTITNCFVMSLAVADWLVGVFVLPPAVAYQLMGTWELGWVLCDLWVSLDVLLCTASILSLCAISVDRYLAVTQPLNYSRRRRSKRLALLMILAVWVMAAAITCPPILGWYEAGRHSNKTCRYNQNSGYVVFSAMGSFFVPLVVMLYVYARIHLVVMRRHDNLSTWDSRQTTRKLRDVTLDVRSPVPCSYSSCSGQSAQAGQSVGQGGQPLDASRPVARASRCQTCGRAACAACGVGDDVGERLPGRAQHGLPADHAAQQRAGRPEPPPPSPPPPSPPSPPPEQAPAPHVLRRVRGRGRQRRWRRAPGLLVPPRRVQDGQDAVDAGGRLRGVLAALLRRLPPHALPARARRVQAAQLRTHLARVDQLGRQPLHLRLLQPGLPRRLLEAHPAPLRAAEQGAGPARRHQEVIQSQPMAPMARCRETQRPDE